MNYNEKIVSKDLKQDMKQKHDNNRKWRNYISAHKNPFVKDYLMSKYKGICQYCGLPIKKNLQFCHKTYDKECITDNTIKVKHSTKYHPNGTRNVPDCENCVVFYECIDDYIFPVHTYCNFLINQTK